VDLYLCSTQFREWESAIQYSIIATTTATAIIITTYNISTTRDISEFSQCSTHICIVTPSAVFVSICIGSRDIVISPSPSSAFRNTRTDTVHNTPPTTYIQRCEYCQRNLSTVVMGQDKRYRLKTFLAVPILFKGFDETWCTLLILSVPAVACNSILISCKTIHLFIVKVLSVSLSP
jgi:hypothetical protein